MRGEQRTSRRRIARAVGTGAIAVSRVVGQRPEIASEDNRKPDPAGPHQNR